MVKRILGNTDRCRTFRPLKIGVIISSLIHRENEIREASERSSINKPHHAQHRAPLEVTRAAFGPDEIDGSNLGNSPRSRILHEETLKDWQCGSEDVFWRVFPIETPHKSLSSTKRVGGFPTNSDATTPRWQGALPFLCSKKSESNSRPRRGTQEKIFIKRQPTYLEAQSEHTERWFGFKRVWNRHLEVKLNTSSNQIGSTMRNIHSTNIPQPRDGDYSAPHRLDTGVSGTKKQLEPHLRRDSTTLLEPDTQILTS